MRLWKSLSSLKAPFYQVGTWTPVVSDASSGGNTASFDANATFQKYTKIGNMITLIGRLDNINTGGMTGGNDLFIQGLPETAAAAGNHYGSVSVNLLTYTGSDLSVNIPAGADYAVLLENTTTASSARLDVAAIDGATSDIRFQITYFV